MPEVTLRAAIDADVAPLVEILSEPLVARWWGSNDSSTVRGNLDITFVVLVDGETAGLMLYEEEKDPEYRHVSLDISLAARFQGQGIAADALRQAIRHFARGGHHRFAADPAADNENAIKAYAKVGFKPVGVMRKYERRGEDQPFHDSLLMDLLVEELRD
jgi:aminoglycoside 6'-N-acetyltransferase